MKANLRLIIGNKNYSSWSLRPWLLLRYFDIPFIEQMVSLIHREDKQRLGDLSPTGQVPVLWVDSQPIWDSLAICEWVNENCLDGQAWPVRPHLRGLGRSMSAEIHSGFTMMRRMMPMNCRARIAIPDMPTALADELVRIEYLWQQSLDSSGGPWLLGKFSIADCMYAPVVLLLKTYSIEIDEPLASYCRQVCELPAMESWLADAYQETEVIEAIEQLYNGYQ